MDLVLTLAKNRSELAAKRTHASIMPRRRPQFPQPEMIVAKRANKCWSAGRNRPKTSPEYRRSQEGADRASARRFVARAIPRRQNGLSGRAAYVRASGRGRQFFESCNCHKYQDIDRLARDRQP